MGIFDREQVDSIILHFIDKVLKPQSKREVPILRMFICGTKIRDIADYFGLSATRVCTLVKRGMGDLVDGMISNKELMEENASLRATIAQKDEEIAKVKDELTWRLGQLKVSKELEKKEEEVPDLMKTLRESIDGCDIPVRALHCLHSADIYTLGELVTYRREDLLQIRFMGKKTVAALEKFLASKGLKLNMPIAYIYESGKEALNEDVSAGVSANLQSTIISSPE